MNKVTDSLAEKLNQLQTLVKEYTEAKKSKLVMPESLKRLSSEVKNAKKSLKKDWKQWRRFSKSIMRLKVKAA